MIDPAPCFAYGRFPQPMHQKLTCDKCGAVFLGSYDEILFKQMPLHRKYCSHPIFTSVGEVVNDEMKFSEMYKGGDLMSVAKLKDAQLFGKELTISEMETREFEDDKGREQTKLILSFAGIELKLSVNKTNADILKAKFGDDMDQLIGKNIVLQKVKTKDLKGQPVDGIQVVD